MDVLGAAGQVELNLFRTQSDKETQMRALASGLRVVSASDDPSGMAIADTIQTKVSGLQQGVQNVQNAGNVLNVADGALSTVQNILIRIHSLVVEAHSGLNSVEQLQAIQTEIGQLLQEINKVGEQTQFNGRRLLDGSFDTSAAQDAQAFVIGSEPNSDGTIAGSQLTNYDGFGNPGPILPDPGVVPGSSLPVLISVHIQSYSSDPNTTDPDTGFVVGPADWLQIVQYSNAPGFGSGAQENDTQAAPVNSGAMIPYGPNSNGLFAQLNAPSGAVTYEGGFANLTPQDVGVAETIITTAAKAAGTGTALQVNSNGSEGGVVSMALPTMSASALGISNITVLDPTVVNYQNTVQGTGDNTYATDDAQARIEMAQQQISQARAQIGAQTVALQEDASGSSTQIVNQIASESAIRDADVGSAATKLAKDQVLSQIATSVISQMQSDAKLVLQLFKGPAAANALV